MGDARARAEALKAQGNSLYGRGDAAGAEAAYTRAIEVVGLQPPAPLVSLLSVLHSNRALSRKACGDWEGTEADASAACSLDRMNAKAAYLLGLALSRRGEHAAAVASFQRGLDKAARSPGGVALSSDLAAALARARAAGALAACDRARAGDAELHSFLVALLEAHVARCTNDGDAASSSAAEAHGMALAVLFAERERNRACAAELPDAMACPIGMEAMLDPVVSPSGHTYERKHILAALRRKTEDPIARSPLTPAQLVPNHAMRNAVLWFLEAHPEQHPLAGGKGGSQ